MNYEEARNKYIQSWGALGSSWGISRTMAQIHAVLMVSPDAMTTDDIMEELGISRGNVSMSLRGLIEWGIVYKEYVPGDRKEFYRSEKDVWILATQVAKERRKRELEPIIRMLGQVTRVEDETVNKRKMEEFKKVTNDLNKFAKQSDTLLELFGKAEESWFFSKLIKLFAKK